MAMPAESWDGVRGGVSVYRSSEHKELKSVSGGEERSKQGSGTVRRWLRRKRLGLSTGDGMQEEFLQPLAVRKRKILEVNSHLIAILNTNDGPGCNDGPGAWR